ncbi:hypothetical protein K439DRAFT_70060 [Ramaria rubella]|nr:hypothetical protein K439DRAFT_69731 [Ramaria rubella]KAF8583374.1 hypothetical protein K439DRAFT_70060 [Ramaria rubella]
MCGPSLTNNIVAIGLFQSLKCLLWTPACHSVYVPARWHSRTPVIHPGLRGCHTTPGQACSSSPTMSTPVLL